MRVDIHAHYWPAEYLALLNKLGLKHLGEHFAHPADFSARFAQMDEAEIDCQVLMAIGLDTQLQDEAKAVQAAQCINDIYKNLMEKHPGRFQAFGWVPLPFVDAALEEASRCLNQLGFTGIGLPPSFAGRALDDPDFEPFWQLLDAKKAVVFVHPVGAHSCNHVGLDKYNLDITCGSPTQMSMVAMRLVYSGVTQRYPNIRFVMGSCGGTLPFIWPQVEDSLRMGFGAKGFFGWVKDTGLNPADPMAEFKRFYYDTWTHYIPLTMAAVQSSFGFDRLVYGSDAPFGSPINVRRYIENCELMTEAEKHRLIHQSAQNILQLDKKTALPCVQCAGHH